MNRPVMVVGTPGRLAELSREGVLATHRTAALVLDEVDQLLEPHFREDLGRILEHTGAQPRARRCGRHALRPLPQVGPARSMTCSANAAATAYTVTLKDLGRIMEHSSALLRAPLLQQ